MLFCPMFFPCLVTPGFVVFMAYLDLEFINLIININIGPFKFGILAISIHTNL